MFDGNKKTSILTTIREHLRLRFFAYLIIFGCFSFMGVELYRWKWIWCALGIILWGLFLIVYFTYVLPRKEKSPFFKVFNEENLMRVIILWVFGYVVSAMCLWLIQMFNPWLSGHGWYLSDESIQWAAIWGGAVVTVCCFKSFSIDYYSYRR